MTSIERVMVFIDNRNIYFSFKEKKFICDYRLLLNQMVKGRINKGSFLYMGIKIPISKEDATFERYLRNIGINPIFRSLSISGGKIKENIQKWGINIGLEGFTDVMSDNRISMRDFLVN